MEIPRARRRVLGLCLVLLLPWTRAVQAGQVSAGNAGVHKPISQEDYIKLRARAEVMSEARSIQTPADPEHQLLVGLTHQWGYGIRQDFAEAAKWYHKAAENGATMAMVLLGNVNDVGGYGVTANDQEALRWYRAAAERGDSVGQFNVGVMYMNAEGVPRDYAEAAAWYRKSAEQGNVLAIEALLELHKRRHGVSKSTAEGVTLLEQWANGGNVGAQATLGALYAAGSYGVRRDYGRALELLRAAALQGHSYAQFGLGFMYSQGKGVPKDEAEAVSWYRKSAEQWNARGQANLAAMYEEGRGVPKDKVTASMWLTLADEGGVDVGHLRFDWRRLRLTLTRGISEEEDRQRRKLVTEWKRSHIH
jgi:TPR repeat protein